jgi:agmatine deiminase
MAYLGVEKIVWLGEGVYLDETNGHVDNLCCFLRPGVVALTWCDDPADPQHTISEDALARLTHSTDARGRAFEVVKLPAPTTPLTITHEESAGVATLDGRHARVAGARLAASYVNFLIVNNGIILPTFGDPADVLAREILAAQFPARRVRQVPGREILLGGGNVHCITQQQPMGRRHPAGCAVQHKLGGSDGTD